MRDVKALEREYMDVIQKECGTAGWIKPVQ
jgi:hypothetical protein